MKMAQGFSITFTKQFTYSWSGIKCDLDQSQETDMTVDWKLHVQLPESYAREPKPIYSQENEWMNVYGVSYWHFLKWQHFSTLMWQSEEENLSLKKKKRENFWKLFATCDEMENSSSH